MSAQIFFTTAQATPAALRLNAGALDAGALRHWFYSDTIRHRCAKRMRLIADRLEAGETFAPDPDGPDHENSAAQLLALLGTEVSPC